MRMDFYLYKLQSAVDSSVAGILVSEIPLIAACVAIILVLGLSFSRLFTRKIEELTDNMNRVNQGAVRLRWTAMLEMKLAFWCAASEA